VLEFFCASPDLGIIRFSGTVVGFLIAGVWKKLETIYMKKSLTNKLLLKQRLFSLRMKEGSSLKEHLDALNSILMDLKNVKVKIEDEDAALIPLVVYQR
nr:retrovirus-related Pol polyprotein from transposon TNT 1-94 [Tanacetum cinerariifolium]